MPEPPEPERLAQILPDVIGKLAATESGKPGFGAGYAAGYADGLKAGQEQAPAGAATLDGKPVTAADLKNRVLNVREVIKERFNPADGRAERILLATDGEPLSTCMGD